LTVEKFARPEQALDSMTKKLQLPITHASRPAKESTRKFRLNGAIGAHETPSAELFFHKTADGQLKPVWSVRANMHTNSYHALVDAEDTENIVSVMDYAKNDASYQVFPWGCVDPDHCDREIIEEPKYPSASPSGWHSENAGPISLSGNNARSVIMDKNQTRADGYTASTPDGKFIFPLELEPKDFTEYRDASETQMFYMANMYHDVMYDFGFDEKSGNYEMNNGGKGGIGNDIVYTVSQSTDSLNNAQFHTAPDGKPGVLTVFMYKNKGVWRDGAFDASVVVHELTHGLSTRLVGGPANSDCLQTPDAGGMGEGWSDSMANAIHVKPTDDRNVTMSHAAWASDNPKGVRGYLYSTNKKINPNTFGTLNVLIEVHQIGEVWAEIQYNLLWDLIDAYGIDDCVHPTFDSNGVATDGRFYYIQLITESFKMSKCNPHFEQARDALLDADRALTDGANQCLIWKAMADRGLGVGAKTHPSDSAIRMNVTESFDLPKGVC
jgi:extracellular elastinolytic metalloproteinase